MKRKLLYGFLCLSILTMTGCGNAKLKNGEEVAASVDGYKISANELYNELKTKGGSSIAINMIDANIANKEVKTTDEIKSAANATLDQLKSQYEQYKMDFNAALKQAGYKNEKVLLDEIIIEEKKKKLADDYIKKEITEEEIEEYYENEITGEITAKHILIKPKTKEGMAEDEIAKAEKEAKKKAEEIIEKLDNGEKFDKLAKKYSDDKATASKGGLFADFTKEDVVEGFWNGAIELQDGKYSSEPVKSEYGYHVILKVSQKEKPKLKDVKEDIINSLVENKKKEDQDIVKDIWATIREDHKLKFNDKQLKKDYEKSLKPSEQPQQTQQSQQ